LKVYAAFFWNSRTNSRVPKEPQYLVKIDLASSARGRADSLITSHWPPITTGEVLVLGEVWVSAVFSGWASASVSVLLML
jgi:hypothetical protein